MTAASIIAVALLFAAGSELSGRTALESFAHALRESGGIPRSQRAMRRLCARFLIPSFRPVSTGDSTRWQSVDGRCLMEIVPSTRPDRGASEIRFGCRFSSAREAEDFLRSVVIRPMQPPLPDHFPEEMHHRGALSGGGRMVEAEYDYSADGDSWDATVAFTDGWRVVLPLEPGGQQ